MTSFISVFEIISLVRRDPFFFLVVVVVAVVAVAAAVDPNGNKTHVANGLNTFFIRGTPAFSNGPKSLPKNHLDCPIISKWGFDNSILAEETFAKHLQSLGTCLLINNNLCGKLVSSLELPITFDERFKVI